jgi:hypothetical protein
MKAGAVALVVLSALVAVPAPVQAHSASDAYLNLSVEKAGPRGMLVVHGQWDIALRDLDFVLKLDDDGDGRLRWGEVKHHQAAIERYASGVQWKSRPCLRYQADAANDRRSRRRSVCRALLRRCV